MTTMTFTKTAPPQWLLDMWKEIDDKTFGKGFDCFAEDAICNLGAADWHGREAIRNNLRAFIDKGFTALHDVVEYWDSPSLKVFRGTVTMKFDDAFLLHGQSRSLQGQALVRVGRADRLLIGWIRFQSQLINGRAKRGRRSSSCYRGSFTLKIVNGPERGKLFLNATSHRWESAMYR